MNFIHENKYFTVLDFNTLKIYTFLLNRESKFDFIYFLFSILSLSM